MALEAFNYQAPAVNKQAILGGSADGFVARGQDREGNCTTWDCYFKKGGWHYRRET